MKSFSIKKLNKVCESDLLQTVQEAKFLHEARTPFALS